MRKFLTALLEHGLKNPQIAERISAWCATHGVKEVSLGFGKAYMLATGEILQVRDNGIFFRGEAVRSGLFDWMDAKEYLCL